ncbi:SHOCT domain-containing protein [Alteribacillus bidgolensis]|uniref:Putative membrane protein n=1 Tax=Alteribacillus bidgolensis TaxID=930129 RepID=A0A1G8R6C6_9BACI|nr:SHOCT domain-containing protein [Alteribacillus bidgolensis]SDJ12532.1 putative membrane protein [Alteribacillus bidgolensis]
MMSMMNGGMMISNLLAIVLVGLLIYGLLSLVIKPFEKRKDSSLELLRERFASGEIDEEEYQRRKEFLKKE